MEPSEYNKKLMELIKQAINAFAGSKYEIELDPLYDTKGNEELNTAGKLQIKSIKISGMRGSLKENE
jgi:hypothetical protein